jgi:DNA-binding XRE family transcriptional regulator
MVKQDLVTLFWVCYILGMENSITPPRKLKALIVTRGVSQITVAKDLGISATHLNRILSSRYRPSWPLIVKINDWSDGIVNLDDWRSVFQDLPRGVGGAEANDDSLADAS